MRFNRYAGMTYGEASVQRAKDRAANAEANAAKRAARTTATMTCQCCGRPIMARKGVIAHHGFQRPGWGWQTSSCYGARVSPFEASRDALGAMLEMLANTKHNMKDQRDAVLDERVPVTLHYTDYSAETNPATGRKPTKTIDVTRATFDAVRRNMWDRFEDVLTKEVDRRNREIQAISAEIVMQSERFAAWKQTHKWDKVKAAFVPC